MAFAKGYLVFHLMLTSSNGLRFFFFLLILSSREKEASKCEITCPVKVVIVLNNAEAKFNTHMQSG